MDSENEINKIRWARWRAKQKTEREKTCFYCWSDVPHAWNDDGYAEGNYIDIYSSAAVKIWEGVWLSGTQEWLYQCRICGGGAVRLKPDAPNWVDGWGCFCHFLRITETYNKENFRLSFDPSNPERMGAVPHSGPGEDYSGVYSALEALANVMINLIGGYVSYAWAVAGPFIDDLISAIDTENLESEKLTCQFDYPREETGDYNWPADCGCWYWWEIRVKPSQTIKFKIYEYHLGVENAWDAWAVEHSWTPTINSPPNPDGMSVAEMRKYGIEEIPVSKIKKRADELGISSTRVKELSELGMPVYIARSRVVIEKHPIRVFRTDMSSFRSEFDRRTRSE